MTTTLDRWDVRRYLNDGYQVVAQSETELVLHQPVEQHILGNLFMTFITLGLWLIPWLIFSTFARRHTVVIDLTVDPGPEPPSGLDEFKGTTMRTIRADETTSGSRVRLPGLVEEYRLVEDMRIVDLGSGAPDYAELTIWAPIGDQGAEIMTCVIVDRHQPVDVED